MLEGLRDLIWGRRVVPAAPPAFVPRLPELDEKDELDDEGEPDLESVAGIGCIVTYADSKGIGSVRRVTCRKISERAAVHYLTAFCHERSAVRTFRIDRMLEVSCGVTGEVFTPGQAFFTRYGITSDGGAAIGFGLAPTRAADLRAGLNVLAFLARVDGSVVPEEREVMEDFCHVFASRYGAESFDADGVYNYACRLAPDTETFYVSMERLTRPKAPEGLLDLTRGYAGKMIDADGIQDPKELYYAVSLNEYLQAAAL